MDYGEVLGKAWNIIWRHKVLWIFGILAGCSNLGGNAGGGGRGNIRYDLPSDGPLPPGVQGFFYQLQRFFENIPPWVWILLALLGFFLAVLFIFLTTVGRIGLIRGASQVDEGVQQLSFGPLFSESFPYFLRVFVLNLIMGLGFGLLVILIIIPLVLLSVATLGVGLLCLIPFICLLVPLGWLVNVITIQSDIAIVTENRGILAGLQRGWEVVTRNLGAIIVTGLILLIIGFVTALLIGLPLVLLVIPAVLGIAIGEGAAQIGLVTALVIFLLYLPILLVLNGIVQSYITTTWTLTFRRLIGHRPVLDLTPQAIP